MFRPLSACLLAVTSALTAQDVRELSSPVATRTLVGATIQTIASTTSAGYRLVDIDYRETSALGALYDASFVQNTGAYNEAWWWYTGLTAAQVTSNLTANSARLIDIDPYEEAGAVRFNCIMVDNTGANFKQTWWTSGVTTAAISTQLSANNARLVDLDSYTIGATTYYAAVMTSNTGADARAWWWYLNVTPAQISTYVNSNSAQLYDLEPRSNGNFDCVMVQNPTSPAWYWWTGISASQVSYLIGQYGIRVIDIDSYLVGSTRVYAMVGINNSNALTTSVGNAMRASTNGQVGCWLQRLNSTNLANLNGDAQFEPASTMKTLHHTHAMRQVSMGLPLTTGLTVYTAISGASCPVDVGNSTVDLQTTLQRMMENSDNSCTQAVRAYFGNSSLNATATALGMTGTSSNHRLGCPEALTNPNRITLRDLNTLHTQVANGYLGGQRALFYQLMLDSVNDLGIASIINAEGAALGLSPTTISSFRNFTDVAHKGGNYEFPGETPPVYHRCEFGYLSLPFITNDVITPREFGFGAFVNFATVDAGAVTAIYTDAIPEMLRPQIRAALQSWTNSLAGVASIGAGCGGYTHTVSGLPRLGATATYNAVGGYANGITMFAVGFSASNAGGVPLPFNLQPLGGEFGCVALNDIQISAAGIASSAGNLGFPLTVPSAVSGIGFQYYTQMYSFGPSSFRTSNGQRSIVGL